MVTQIYTDFVITQVKRGEIRFFVDNFKKMLIKYRLFPCIYWFQ